METCIGWIPWSQNRYIIGGGPSSVTKNEGLESPVIKNMKLIQVTFLQEHFVRPKLNLNKIELDSNCF